MNELFRRWYFPLVLQLLTLGVFALLILGSIGADTSDMAFATVLRNTNLANLVVWSYWWPMLVLSAILFGRLWCMVCPMELVTSLAGRVGLKRRPPQWLRSGWVITLFYILILFVGITTLAIHRVPYRMALYMLILSAAAVAVGLLYRRNTFCAYVCPVGHLLGLYARLSPFGWGVRNQDICRSCRDRSCVALRNAYRFQGRSCGVGLDPSRLDDNTTCLLCGQCLKACDKNNPGIEGRPNPGWFRRPWFKDLLALKPLNAAQVAFCLVVSGFVLYEVTSEWSLSEALLTWVPARLQNAMGASGIWSTGLIKSLTLFVALPALIWMVPYAACRLLAPKTKLGDYLQTTALAVIPIMAAMHAVKALLKTTSRIPYWEYSVADPVGLKTAQAIARKSVQLWTLPSWAEAVITGISLILWVLGVVLSILVIRRCIASSGGRSTWCTLGFYLLPVLYGGIFGLVLIGWRLLPLL